MNTTVKNIGKGVAASAVAVSAIAIGIRAMKKPKKQLKKTAAKALDSLGDMMISAADMIK